VGLFGNPASIIVDVNLIIQWVIFVLLLVGYLMRGQRKTHGYLMVVALVLNLVTTLVVMAPSLVLNIGTLPITVLPHAAVGIIAILLGFLFTFKWLMALRSSKPVICGTRGMMRLAFVLWIVPVFFGTFLYLTIYVL
jgi:hypothetical protein